MAVANGTAADALCALKRWRWVGIFMLVSLMLAAWVPSHQAIGARLVIASTAIDWSLSPGMEMRRRGQDLVFSAIDSGPQSASRALRVPQDSDFLSLRLCLVEKILPDSAAIMLASVRASVLDFNRQYRLYSVAESGPGDCVAESLPRRSGDGLAVLQIQLVKAESTLALSDLSVTPLRENRQWRGIRLIMLVLGIALVTWVFSAYWNTPPQWLFHTPSHTPSKVVSQSITMAGLVTVAGIIFGCCVNVHLKADIFALLAGGRSTEPGLSLAEILQTPFPVAGFSLFTTMHAVLFCVGTLSLAFIRRYAWVDMLMLGLTTETLQAFVPGRGPGLSDVMVDWLGVAGAMLLVFLLRRSQRVSAFLQDKSVKQNTSGFG